MDDLNEGVRAIEQEEGEEADAEMASSMTKPGGRNLLVQQGCQRVGKRAPPSLERRYPPRNLRIMISQATERLIMTAR